MDDMLTTERQGDQDLQAAADAGGHIIAWADDWEVSGVQEEQYEITVPTVADRIAQPVVALRLEARAESIFDPDFSAVGLRGLRAGCATSSVGSGGVRRAMEASDFGYHSVEHSGGRWARPPRMASMVMPSFAA
jgi:hypothetical protein